VTSWPAENFSGSGDGATTARENLDRNQNADSQKDIRELITVKIGDRVEFRGSGQHFLKQCDSGVIIGRNGPFDRPWKVRWDHGPETYPLARYLVPEPQAAVTVTAFPTS
jgi:hypothetical protein